MNKIVGGVLRFRLVTLCCAGAVWATAGLSAQGGPPASGAHGFHNGFNGGFNNGFNGRNGFGSFGGWGGELFGFELGGSIENRIPFYALHPPVYYSYPIARPYGDSPFASPPAYYGPGIADGGPQTIINPYAAPGGAAPSNATPSNSTPSAPAPASPLPSAVKPTAGRTASAEEASPSIETLPAPEPVSQPDAGSEAAGNVQVVLNPFVK
jgi:hypothetical protein